MTVFLFLILFLSALILRLPAVFRIFFFLPLLFFISRLRVVLGRLPIAWWYGWPVTVVFPDRWA